MQNSGPEACFKRASDSRLAVVAATVSKRRAAVPGRRRADVLNDEGLATERNFMIRLTYLVRATAWSFVGAVGLFLVMLARALTV